MATGLLAQESDPVGKILNDAHNGFNKLNLLEILWPVRQCWTAGVLFTLNCYKNWAQLLIRRPGIPSATLLIQEGVIKWDPLLMVLYRIALFTLVGDLHTSDLGLITSFYVYDMESNVSMRRITQIMKLFLDHRLYQG